MLFIILERCVGPGRHVHLSHAHAILQQVNLISGVELSEGYLCQPPYKKYENANERQSSHDTSSRRIGALDLIVLS
jgi:hypothetical protein